MSYCTCEMHIIVKTYGNTRSPSTYIYTVRSMQTIAVCMHAIFHVNDIHNYRTQNAKS
jgi:hypothetical protein